jgi:hypothetical protein
MASKKKEKMHEALAMIINVVRDCITRDLSQKKNLNLLLDVYNYWQEEEHDGYDYIFNIDNQNDLKYLVDNDMITAPTIAWIMKQETHLFVFGEDADAGVEIISMDKLIGTLLNNTTGYTAYAIMYVGRCGKDSPYADFYEEYVTKYIEDFFN